MGAYDGERLVGVAQLYLDETYVKQIKEALDLQKNKVVELTGAKLVKTMKLGEYLRNIWVLDLRK